MDEFCQYNLFRKPRPNLFIAPPYDRAAETRGERRQTPLLHLRATDPSKILLLCESLKDQCTLDLEAKINCYLMSEGECECAFIASFEVLPKLAVVKVISVHALQPQLQLPATEYCFLRIAEDKAGVDLLADDLPPLLSQQLLALKLDTAGADICAYPIFEQNHRNGIIEETSTITLIAFIINSTLQRTVLKDIVQECFRFVLPVYRNTSALERQTLIKSRMQELLDVGQDLFSNLDNKDDLLNVIMERGKLIFDSERCDVYFIDDKEKNLEANVICHGKISVDTVPKNSGVIGKSYIQKKLVNIPNAQDNALYNKVEDDKCGYTTRNILCFPIPTKQRLLGCIQLRNKFSGDYNVFDENMSIYFAQYVGLALSQCNLLVRLHTENDRHQIANKFLLFPFDFREAEVEHLLQAVRHDLPGFNNPTYNARDVPYHRVGVCLMKMFEDLGFITVYKLDKRALAKFLVYVQKGYFNHPFHNYNQAFCAVHFVYSTICYLQLLERQILSGQEAIALLVAAICHNVDHHGLTNPFRTVEDSTFGSVYSSSRSIMETHHFAQAMTILNSQGCNFLENFPLDEYSAIIKKIKQNIIATDYAEHLKNCKKQELLLGTKFRPKVPEQKDLFCALLMTCGNFVDQIRDWRTVRNVVAQMYEEYFRQGDLEREMGKEPIEMLDREKARIPLLQIEFLKDIVLPPYDLLGRMYPEMHFCVDAINETITNWEMVKSLFVDRTPEEATSLELLQGHQLDLTNLAASEEDYTEMEEEIEEEEEY